MIDELRNKIEKRFPENNRFFLEHDTALQFYDYMKYMPNEGRLIEIGTGSGDSADFFSMVKPNWTIYTIDGYGLFGDGDIFPYTKKDELNMAFFDLSKNLFSFENKKIIQICQDSKKVPWELPIDLIYIDGDHTYEGCKADFNKFSPFLKSNGYIFFHDYSRQDLGVKQFVDEICKKDWKLLMADKAAIVEKNE